MFNTPKNQAADPYGQWALDTDLRRFRRTRIIDFLVELNSPVTKQIFTSFETGVKAVNVLLWQAFSKAPVPLRQGVPPTIDLTMPDVYFESLPRGKRSTFVTLRMRVTTNDKDASIDWPLVKEAVRAVLSNPYVKRIQIGHPNYRFDDAKDDDPHREQAPGSHNRTASVVLGLLDDAIPFAHASLKAQSGSSRVVALWHQGHGPRGTQWVNPSRFSYGAEMSGTEMTNLIARHGGDEDAIYADLEEGRGVSPLRSRVSHGGMILPLMAGQKHMPAPPSWAKPDDERPVTQRPSPDADAVSGAPIIGVSFPALHTKDTGGRWMAVNALDGLRFILDRARSYETSEGRPTPIVVNLSYGALAGAHDGTSLLESAIEELVKAYDSRLAVVLAAGNHHGTRRAPDGDETGDQSGAQSLPRSQPSELHARFKLGASQTQMLTLFVPPDKQEETSLEIWMHSMEGGEKVPLAADERLSVKVTAPNGSGFSANKMGESQLWPTGTATRVAGLYLKHRVAQSNRRSMALLVIAPTQVHSRLPSSLAGRWTVEITNNSGREIAVDAYVERDDTVVGAKRDQAARLVALNGDLLSNADTLSDIASGSQVFRVGALQDMGSGPEASRVARYSAEGNSQLMPELSALTDQGLAMPGIRVSGSQSGMVVRANGTSMAAPQAARWIANQLSGTAGAPKTLAEIRQAIDPNRTTRRGKVIP